MEGIAHGMKPRSKSAPSVAVAKKFVADSTKDGAAEKLGAALARSRR
jgi:hypothetical protein